MNIAKVAYVFGNLEGRGLLDPHEMNFGDIDELYAFFESVYLDWKDYKDIRTEGEEGYILEYAERVLLEKFGRKEKV